MTPFRRALEIISTTIDVCLSVLLEMFQSNRFKNDYLFWKNGFYRATLCFLSVTNILESSKKSKNNEKCVPHFNFIFLDFISYLCFPHFSFYISSSPFFVFILCVPICFWWSSQVILSLKLNKQNKSLHMSSSFFPLNGIGTIFSFIYLTKFQSSFAQLGRNFSKQQPLNWAFHRCLNPKLIFFNFPTSFASNNCLSCIKISFRMFSATFEILIGSSLSA